MSKRQRSRQRHRQRRFVPRAAPAPSERESSETHAPAREAVRPRFGRAAAIGRASGPPSNALLRAATIEYGHVVDDLKRVAIVTIVVLVLLGAATVGANLFFG